MLHSTICKVFSLNIFCMCFLTFSKSSPLVFLNTLKPSALYNPISLESYFCGINPFYANVPFLYSLKTSENQRFSDVFRGYGNGSLVSKSLMTTWKCRFMCHQIFHIDIKTVSLFFDPRYFAVL